MDSTDSGRPDRRSAAKRAAILEAAVALFLERGFARTSIDAVAHAAGVGKQTVYSHFSEKEALFLAAVDRARATSESAEHEAPPDPAHPAEGLRLLGTALLQVVLDPTVAALQRLTIGELPHHPELQTMWRSGAQDTSLMRAVTDYLVACDALGSLRSVEPATTARQFVFLVATEARTATAYGTAPLTDSERERILRETVSLFAGAVSA